MSAGPAPFMRSNHTLQPLNLTWESFSGTGVPAQIELAWLLATSMARRTRHYFGAGGELMISSSLTILFPFPIFGNTQ
jgi:hypothetical protein